MNSPLTITRWGRVQRGSSFYCIKSARQTDLIVTKSVSRFARNTVDSLTTIRKLKEHGTEVFFEKENIWTFEGRGELLLTIMSSLAQEESRSISENVRWGLRKKAADGKFSLNYSYFLGYDKGPDGKLVVNKEQAAVVRRILAWRVVRRGGTCFRRADCPGSQPGCSGYAITFCHLQPEPCCMWLLRS